MIDNGMKCGVNLFNDVLGKHVGTGYGVWLKNDYKKLFKVCGQGKKWKSDVTHKNIKHYYPLKDPWIKLFVKIARSHKNSSNNIKKESSKKRKKTSIIVDSDVEPTTKKQSMYIYVFKYSIFHFNIVFQYCVSILCSSIYNIFRND